MPRLAIVFVYAVALASAQKASVIAAAPATPPATRPSPVAVTGTRMTFDPRTATEGTGGFAWGLGSVFVTLRGHRDGRCEFDYRWEVEGAGDYAIYRVSVPLDAGPVVIEATPAGDDAHRWSRVCTSFTKEQATLVRTARRGWFVDPLTGTTESVTHRTIRPGDRDRPLAGARDAAVTVRFLVCLPGANGEFGGLAGEEWRRQGATVPLTGETEWKWVQQLLQDMTLYEIRQVRLPARVAGPAARWLPGYKEDSEVLVEVQPVAVARR